MLPDEAEQVGWGQIVQGFVGYVKEFGSYSMSNRMPLKYSKQEQRGEV